MGSRIDRPPRRSTFKAGTSSHPPDVALADHVATNVGVVIDDLTVKDVGHWDADLGAHSRERQQVLDDDGWASQPPCQTNTLERSS